MGRLYDKEDLAWNLKYWRTQETLLNMKIANGEVDKSILNMTISYPGREGPDGWAARHMRVRDKWDYECKREYYKLLKTGQLLGNLRAWEGIFKACSKCYVRVRKGKTFDEPCDEHSVGYRTAKSAVYWAGERNLAERNERGQVRAEGVVTAQEALEGVEPTIADRNEPQNPPNKWEVQYATDKAEGMWPGPANERARIYEVEPNYKGWLRMLLEEEEMTETEYLQELQRLREQGLEMEALPAVTDRNLPSTLPKRANRGQQSFHRDSRYNQLSN